MHGDLHFRGHAGSRAGDLEAGGGPPMVAVPAAAGPSQPDRQVTTSSTKNSIKNSESGGSNASSLGSPERASDGGEALAAPAAAVSAPAADGAAADVGVRSAGYRELAREVSYCGDKFIDS